MSRDNLLTLKQVATRLSTSVKTVRRRIANRELTAIQLSTRAWRVDEDDLLRYLERNTQRSTNASKPLRFRPNVSNG